MILDNTIPFNQHSFKFFSFFTIHQNAEKSGKDFIIWVTVVPHQSGSAPLLMQTGLEGVIVKLTMSSSLRNKRIKAELFQ